MIRKFFAASLPLIVCAAAWLLTQARPHAFQTPSAAVPAPRSDNAVVRSRRAALDLDALTRPVNPGGAPATRIMLNLFDDTVFTATLDHVDRIDGGLVWVGRLDDEPSSTVTLSRVDGVLTGVVFSTRGVFEIRYAGNGLHDITQVDQMRFPREGRPRETVAARAPSTGAEALGQAYTDDGSTIDVMVLYTPAALAAAGGASAMLSLANNAVSTTNTSYAQSGVAQRIRLVTVQPVNYGESGNLSNDLDNVSNYNGSAALSTSVGNQARSLRDAWSADLVTLITETPNSSLCGIGWQLPAADPTYQYLGFNVVERSCAVGALAYPHELGHNMGARHDWYVDNGTTPYTYAHGYVSTTGRFYTIMSYPDLCQALRISCTRQPYWSNPNVVLGGAPTGIAGGTRSPCPTGSVSSTNCDADDHRTLNNTALAVANFRASVSRVLSIAGDLQFGNVFVGTSSVRSFTITNTGTGALTVAGISYPAGFSGSWAGGTIGPGASQTVAVTFAPPGASTFSGVVMVTADQTSGINTIAISGIGVQPLRSADFDRDSRSDPVVYRPTTGHWYVLTSQSGYSYGSYLDFGWGQFGATPLIGDFDGDGRADPAIYQPFNGHWYVLLSQGGYNGANSLDIGWGQAGAVPLVGDFDGDGRSDPTIYQPSNGHWYVLLSHSGYSTASFLDIGWGQRGAIPIVADFDGDRRSDVAIYQPANGHWYLLLSSTGYDTSRGADIGWGLDSAVPLAGDVDGDGKADLVVYWPGNGHWYVLQSRSGYSYAGSLDVPWGGQPGDRPMVDDFDGDGKSDLVIYRVDGHWYVMLSRSGFSYGDTLDLGWGIGGDVPVVRK